MDKLPLSRVSTPFMERRTWWEMGPMGILDNANACCDSRTITGDVECRTTADISSRDGDAVFMSIVLASCSTVLTYAKSTSR